MSPLVIFQAPQNWQIPLLVFLRFLALFSAFLRFLALGSAWLSLAPLSQVFVALIWAADDFFGYTLMQLLPKAQLFASAAGCCVDRRHKGSCNWKLAKKDRIVSCSAGRHSRPHTKKTSRSGG